MAFQYKNRSTKDHKARTEKQAGHWATLVKPEFKEYKLKEGKNRFRICPPGWTDAKHYGFDLWVHSNVGDREIYLSRKLMLQESDPIAEMIQAAKADGEGESVKSMNPYRRVGMWIIPWDDQDGDPQFLAMPQKLDREIAQAAYDDEEGSELVLVDHHKQGCWITCTGEGTGMQRTYTNLKLGKLGPMSKDKDRQADWLEFIETNTIPDVLNYYSYDHIKAALEGAAKSKDTDEDEDEDDDTPTRRGRTRNKKKDEDEDEDEDAAPKKKKKKRSQIEDEDESLDEDDEPKKKKRRKSKYDDEGEDEDEEEDAPPKRRGRKAKDEEEDEEEEDSDEDDEEEDEDDEDDDPPKKKAKKKSKSNDRDLRKSGGLKKRRRRSREDDD